LRCVGQDEGMRRLTVESDLRKHLRQWLVELLGAAGLGWRVAADGPGFVEWRRVAEIRLLRAGLVAVHVRLVVVVAAAAS